jgi:hypothetical protein
MKENCYTRKNVIYMQISFGLSSSPIYYFQTTKRNTVKNALLEAGHWKKIKMYYEGN